MLSLEPYRAREGEKLDIEFLSELTFEVERILTYIGNGRQRKYEAWLAVINRPIPSRWHQLQSQ